MTPINKIVKPEYKYIPTSQIVEYPFKKQSFTYGEYKNWQRISPRFTLNDYEKYKKHPKKKFIYDIRE